MERREFLGTTARFGAGLTLAGALAACVRDDATTGGTASAPPSSSSSSTTAESTTPASTTPATPEPTLDAVAYRLSTRNVRTACGACKAHAAHRWFATSEAADRHRAHAGCHCAVVAQRVASAQVAAWFAGRDEYDDRWAE